MDMTKFNNLEDSGFILFCERLRRWIKADRKAPSAVYEQSTIGRRRAQQFGNNNRQYNLFGGMQQVTGGHIFKADGDMNFPEIPALPANERTK